MWTRGSQQRRASDGSIPGDKRLKVDKDEVAVKLLHSLDHRLRLLEGHLPTWFIKAEGGMEDEYER